MNEITPTAAQPHPLWQEGFDAAMRKQQLTRTLVAAPGYERLVEVFERAHRHAAYGKGRERHANDLPFDQQRMLSISRMIDSPSGMAYQVMKKITEGLAMDDHNRTQAELYGALNYLAGIVIYLDDKNAPAAASVN